MTRSTHRNIIDAMTRADDTIAAWMLGEVWGAPPDREEQRLKRRRIALAFPDGSDALPHQ